jgi:hypothetical protein
MAKRYFYNKISYGEEKVKAREDKRTIKFFSFFFKTALSGHIYI